VYSGEKSLVSVGIQDKSFLSIEKTWLELIFSRKYRHYSTVEAKQGPILPHLAIRLRSFFTLIKSVFSLKMALFLFYAGEHRASGAEPKCAPDLPVAIYASACIKSTPTSPED
jgi:hypothetical protein